MKTVSILGATGTVGRKALDLISRNHDRFRLETLTAGSDAAGLATLAKAHNARRAILADPRGYSTLRDALAGTGIEVAIGLKAFNALTPVDICIAAIVGIAGLEPVLAAASTAKVLALANKEAVVCAGYLVRQAVEKAGGTLIPVDSEHNALFQLLHGMGRKSLQKVTLTASGGPFRTRPLDSFARITPAEALHHPIWTMGAKISLDSATLMNKGLEVIEAAFLFDLHGNQIDVMIHPQAAIHALAHYHDGSSIAHLSIADMTVPLGHALGWPKRLRDSAPTIDLTAFSEGLDFFKPDTHRYPCLNLAYQALAAGQSACVALNAANEVAGEAFRQGRIAFTDISTICADSLEASESIVLDSATTVLAVDATARRRAEDFIATRRRAD
ncbi:MAG: 1-deoxy-D-xylulose-5-phosphate reductoisomerase [Holosporales bacterium]|jgi:1-deoxy-D-xylulose-5-phosphate reductoisomerase